MDADYCCTNVVSFEDKQQQYQPTQQNKVLMPLRDNSMHQTSVEIALCGN